MSDRIAVINKGRIEQLGSVYDIYHQPRTTFVANFIGEANILPATVVSRSGENVQIKLDDKVELVMRGADVSSDAETLLVSIRPEKIRICKERFADRTNTFEAVIEREVFKGATDELLLRHESGLELTAIAANESALQECFNQGEKVFCSLHPSDIVFVQEEE
jgi:spermidine/putrescine transport system ATP-binding protein